jgi:cell division protein YceG involved in septum cleavage
MLTYRTNVSIVLLIDEMVNEMKENRKHHYRIVKPFRFFLFVVISIMVIVFAGYTAIGAGNAEAAAVRSYVQVTIDEGDNLWSIVERCNKDAHIDVQSAIYDVYEINDIDAADIQPGDKLFIPVY